MINKAEEWHITESQKLWDRKCITRELQMIFNDKIKDVRASSIEKWTEENDNELFWETFDQQKIIFKNLLNDWNIDFDLSRNFILSKLHEDAHHLVAAYNSEDTSDEEKRSLKEISHFLRSVKLYAGLLDLFDLDECFECGIPFIMTDHDTRFGQYCEECNPILICGDDYIVRKDGELNIGCNIEVEGDIIFKTGSTMYLAIDESMDNYPEVKGKIIVEEGVTILDWGSYPDYDVPDPYFNLKDNRGPIDVNDIEWDPRSREWYKIKGYLVDKSDGRIEHDGNLFWHIGKTKKKVEIEKWMG